MQTRCGSLGCLHCGHTERSTLWSFIFCARLEFLRDLYVRFLGTATVNLLQKPSLATIKNPVLSMDYWPERNLRFEACFVGDGKMLPSLRRFSSHAGKSPALLRRLLYGLGVGAIQRRSESISPPPSQHTHNLNQNHGGKNLLA